MNDLVDMIDSGSLSGLLALAATLCCVGNLMVGGDRIARRFGYTMAGIVLFAYGAYSWICFGEYEPSTIQRLLFRTLTAAVLALGFSWIVAVGGLFCWNLLAKGPGKAIGQLRLSWAERRRNKSERADAVADPISPEEAKRLEREDKKREKVKAQRSNLRYELRLLYNQLRKNQLPVFPEKVFEDMIQNALSPDDAKTMNQRIEMLREALLTVDTQDESDKKAKAPANEEEIAAHFRERRLFVQNSDMDDNEKIRLLRALNRREGHAYSRLIKENYEGP